MGEADKVWGYHKVADNSVHLDYFIIGAVEALLIGDMFSWQLRWRLTDQ